MAFRSVHQVMQCRTRVIIADILFDLSRRHSRVSRARISVVTMEGRRWAQRTDRRLMSGAKRKTSVIVVLSKATRPDRLEGQFGGRQ